MLSKGTYHWESIRHVERLFREGTVASRKLQDAEHRHAEVSKPYRIPDLGRIVCLGCLPIFDAHGIVADGPC